MARQLRIEFSGAFYHITSRGNLRETIFYNNKDKTRFLEILKRTKDRYGYLLHAYTLMDNHYHLLIETPKANISQIMQNINTSYTVYINRRYQRSGHLMQGRFKGIIVDKDEYLVSLSRYIHLNPVRAEIVQRPEDCKWTSYRAYIENAVNDGLVDKIDTLSYFSKNKGRAAKAYKAFVAGGIKGGENPFKDIEAGIILGGKGFQEKVMQFLDGIKADEELPQLRKLRKKVPIDKVIKACCDYYGIRELFKRGKGRRDRQIAIYLSKVMSGEKNIEIGNIFGIKGPAVSGVIKAVEGRLDGEERLKREIGQIKERIINE